MMFVLSPIIWYSQDIANSLVELLASVWILCACNKFVKIVGRSVQLSQAKLMNTNFNVRFDDRTGK